MVPFKNDCVLLKIKSINSIITKKTIIQPLFLVAFMFFVIVFTSCSEVCSEDKAAEDASTIATLAFEHSLDPENVEKCQAYVDAVMNFVNDYGDCDNVDEADIQAIEEGIVGLSCG